MFWRTQIASSSGLRERTSRCGVQDLFTKFGRSLVERPSRSIETETGQVEELDRLIEVRELRMQRVTRLGTKRAV